MERLWLQRGAQLPCPGRAAPVLNGSRLPRLVWKEKTFDLLYRTSRDEFNALECAYALNSTTDFISLLLECNKGFL